MEKVSLEGDSLFLWASAKKNAAINATFMLFINPSNQRNIIITAGLAHIVWPDAGLDFANVGLAQEEHTEPRLTNAATD